ncbi:MFS transporter [Gordonia iterans]|uniref:MFS transporter n=1 Tax=Gordonia iterans TaxID=1004901 RepID=A0A2S0KKP2_9ACTN|nr:MFS transporter [Gordonia iterans]AVM02254.1 MFS transporter [Gordonia iterans]
MVTTSASSLPRVLRPFALPQYRWLAAGLALALFGDGVWLIAVVWQVIGLGGGPGQVSLVSGVAAVGMVVSTLFGGVLADRISQRKIIVALETVKLVAFGTVGAASLFGVLTVPHLVVAALLGGITTGMYYPAYSALLPRIVGAAELQAANGVEGFMRPVLFQAAGPMIAGVIIGAASPGTAIAVGALACILSAACYVAMGPVDDEVLTVSAERAARLPVRGVLTDLGEGFGYMRHTPWLWASLFFVSFAVLMAMGPIEVLVPFALRDRAGGDAASHSLVLAAFGAGAALGAFVFASLPMPRRYLSVIFGLWSVCVVPLVIMGFAHKTVWFVIAGFLIGLMLDGPMVLWGTLLQRRVPKELLGRISALDFFVSASLMPVSMALAAPVAHLIGLGWTFTLAGLLPAPVTAVFYVAAKLWRDEIEHPLTIPEIEVSVEPTTK